MANTYSPESLGVKAPSGGFQTGGWYSGRQYWNGTLSDPGVIHPASNQQGAGQTVSAEVNAQSAAQQGVSSQQFEAYLQQQRDTQAQQQVAPVQQAPLDYSGIPTGATTTGSGVGYSAPAAALNLPDLYKSLYESQGISALEKSLSDKAKAFSDAQMKINDNPFLSESSRTGRIQKLQTDYNQNVKNDQDLMVMKKQDIATQLDLATKQFDINSQTAKQALDQFNVLLQSGALAGASGADIANITKATGISSSMIQSAIGSQKEKDRQTSVTTVDDGKNVYSVVIDSKTGAIINKQVIAASKPEKAAATTTADKTSYYQNALRQDAQAGRTLTQIFSLYTGYLDPNTILQLYNANSKSGPYKGDISKLSVYGVKDPSKAPTLAEQLGLTGK